MEIFGSIIIVLILIFIYFQLRGYRQIAPWLPSSMSPLRQALKSLAPTPDTTFIDLGSGDGRAVFLAAKEFQLQATGVEYSPLLWLVSQCKNLFATKKGKFILANALKFPIQSYDILYVYGLPDTMKQTVGAKIIAEAKPGTKLISYNFSLSGKQPDITIHDTWRRLMVYTL